MPLAIPPPVEGLASGSPEHAVMGTGTSIPPGLESILEFNGIYLNDRSKIDTYKITSIGGLEDADIRDDREVNPQAHGETPFDSFYGGRTITLTGYIRAFQLQKLRDMQQALKQAFSNISDEKNLIFHSALTPGSDCLIPVRKNAMIQMSEEQTTEGWFRRDFMITLRASNFRFLSIIDKQSTVFLGRVDQFSAAASLNNYDRPTGPAPSISSGKLAPASTTRVRMIRNDIDEFESSDQTVVIKYEPDATFTSSFIRGVVTYMDDNNFIWAGVTSSGSLSMGKVDGGVTSTFTPTSTTGSTPTRTAGTPYWLRIRLDGNVLTVDQYTTDPRISTSGFVNGAVYTLLGADAVKFGFGKVGDMGIDFQAGSSSWRLDDISFIPYNLNSQVVSVSNSGNFSAQPIVLFTGPMSNPILTNQTNGETLEIDDSIAATDSYSADIAQRTLKNNAGQNKFSKLPFTSDWMELEPGNNDLNLYAESMAAAFNGGVWTVPQLTIFHKDSWI